MVVMRVAAMLLATGCDRMVAAAAPAPSSLDPHELPIPEPMHFMLKDAFAQENPIAKKDDDHPLNASSPELVPAHKTSRVSAQGNCGSGSQG